LEWVDHWIGACPDAASSFFLVAGHPMRTAVRKHPRILVGQHIRWKNQLGFEFHILTNVLAETDFNGLPYFFSHPEPPETIKKPTE